MGISQIVAVGIVGAVLSITLKKTSPEISMFIGITTGLFIFFGVMGQLSAVLDMLTEMTEAAALNKAYISIIMKVVGIAYIAEFGIQACKDAGEGAIASKIELAGKILIMTVSVPVIMGVMEMVTAIFP